MYFDNFDIQDISTDACKNFINKLSNLFICLNPSLIDKEKVEIVCKTDYQLECVKVYIPHKTNRNFDLSIEYNELDCTIQLGNSNFHFHELDENKKQIKDIFDLISKIMQADIEIHTFYKANKKIKIKPYIISQSGEKELLQCTYYNCFTLLNPFLKVKEKIERGKF